MYSIARRAFVGGAVNLGEEDERRANPLFVSYRDLVSGLDLTPGEQADFQSINIHVINGLMREELIEGHFSFGTAEHLRSRGYVDRDYGDGGLIYRIRPLGIELFCSAHGVRGYPLIAFKDPAANFEIDLGVAVGEGSCLVTELPVVAS
jgi:hypothetical protein